MRSPLCHGMERNNNTEGSIQSRIGKPSRARAIEQTARFQSCGETARFTLYKYLLPCKRLYNNTHISASHLSNPMETRNTPPTKYCMIILALVSIADMNNLSDKASQNLKPVPGCRTAQRNYSTTQLKGVYKHILRLLLHSHEHLHFSELAPPFTVVSLVEKLGSPRLSRPNLLSVSRTIITPWRIHYNMLLPPSPHTPSSLLI